LGTFQIDFAMPKRFGLEYTDKDGKAKTPVMIHRAPFGSMERFVAVLIEHCAGNFPLWLTPDQVAILPISEKYNEKAENLLSLLNNYDIRGFIDDRNEKVGRKIRDTELKKVPFMLILGEKEAESNQVSVRKHGVGDLGTFSIEEFANIINEDIKKDLVVNN